MTFRSRLLAPPDEGYDKARVVQNWLIDRHPGLIVQGSDTADGDRCRQVRPGRRWGQFAEPGRGQGRYDPDNFFRLNNHPTPAQIALTTVGTAAGASRGSMSTGEAGAP
jgi:hypothetical protein